MEDGVVAKLNELKISVRSGLPEERVDATIEDIRNVALGI